MDAERPVIHRDRLSGQQNEHWPAMCGECGGEVESRSDWTYHQCPPDWN